MPAIAITIHKSQGSESEKVNILWSQNYRRNQYAVKEKRYLNIFCEIILKEGYFILLQDEEILNIYYLK